MECPAQTNQPPTGVVFDGDDTLWRTEELYDDARTRARQVVAAAGLDGARWEDLERRLDLSNVNLWGFSVQRFPGSCIQAYEEMCRARGWTPDADISKRVREAASAVFERDPVLAPGARETLADLRSRGVRLGLLTKGDPQLQRRRVDRSGLRDLFDVVQIVSDKSPAAIRDVVRSLGVDIRSAWMVGNSVRSDILPAIEAGLRAVWINAHVWEYERAYDHLADEEVVTVSSLVDIPSVISA